MGERADLQIRAARSSSILSTMSRSLPNSLPLVTLAALAAIGGRAYAEDSLTDVLDLPFEDREGGVAIQLDNDLFTGTGRDSDYSWGATLTFAAPQAPRVLAPVEAARRAFAARLPRSDERPRVSRATQIGLIAMTPENLTASEALEDDRPYASLVFATTAELRIFERAGRARFTSFTVGALGLPVADVSQRAVHEVMGGKIPNGWDHQVSDGGEPTARVAWAEQWLIGGASEPRGRELKLTVGGSAGYLTEAGAAVSMRWGRIRTPWWSFNPELGDYGAAPIAPITGFGIDAPPEIYGFVGARVKARAYNALLQGQFRSSDVRVASDDVARIQAEAWAGVTSNWSEWRVTYAVHVASREVTPEPAARTLVWASLSVERAF